MKVAALQTALASVGSGDGLALIRRRMEQCEAEGVAILCCPEAVVCGLADYAPDPLQFAVTPSAVLASLGPMADTRLVTIVGFTELGSDGSIYNSAAIVSRGTLAGVYRKRHPAIWSGVVRSRCAHVGRVKSR